jgi:hypothetical protein
VARRVWDVFERHISKKLPPLKVLIEMHYFDLNFMVSKLD